jgi:hypothetical protein
MKLNSTKRSVFRRNILSLIRRDGLYKAYDLNPCKPDC